MSWNYSPTLTLTRDQVRRLIGDTDTSRQLLQDEEIAFFLTQEANVYAAAAAAAESIAAQFAGRVDKSVSGFYGSAQQLYKQYLAIGKDLRARRGLVYALPSAGGISIAEKQAAEQDTDRVVPFSRREIHDNRGTATTPTSSGLS